MATPAQVAELRPLVDDTVEPYQYDNPTLSTYIDAAGGDLNKAAGQVWTLKAAGYAGLVDVTEGSSSRKMSQLYKQALEMAAHYGVTTEETTTRAGRSGTRAIVRPSA